MTWFLIAFVSVSNFVAGGDVWITMPDESAISFYHDDGFDYIGTHLSYVDPQTGIVRIETAGGGCDMAVAWNQKEIWLQWNPKIIFMDDRGKWFVTQPNCQMFTLWSFK